MGISRISMIIITFLCLIGAGVMTASAGPVGPVEIGAGFASAIHGEDIVWEDVDGAIHHRNLTDGSHAIIAPANASSPAIYAGKIVWLDNSSQQLRLGIHDLGQKRTIYVYGEFDEWSKPSISGSNVVWATAGNVYLYDIVKAEVILIAEGYDPDVSGDRVVYIALIDRGSVVRVYDAHDGNTTTVPYLGNLYSPRIDGWQLIFTVGFEGTSSLYIYDLSQGLLREIAASDIVAVSSDRPEYQGMLDRTAIRDGKVAYVKAFSDDSGDAGIWLYDIESGGKSMPIGLIDRTDLTVDFSRDVLVWGCDSYGPVYAYRLEETGI